MYTLVRLRIHVCISDGGLVEVQVCLCSRIARHDVGWLQLVGSLKLYVTFAKEPYKRDYILQKRPVIAGAY